MNPAHQNTLSPTQFLEIASQQKRLLGLLVISIPVVAGTFCVPSITEPGPVMLILLLLLFVGMIAIGVFSVVAIYRLAKALRVQAPWIYVACSFIPYLNTVTMLIINGRATAALRRAGIHVGLMGADREDLARLATSDRASTEVGSR